MPNTRMDRDWRRFDQDEEWQKRPGALDRRWGYGRRLAPGYDRLPPEEWREDSYDDYQDQYDAPYYWVYEEEWLRPGPYTGVGPKNYRRSDERIQEDVCERLKQNAQIDARDIDVEVHEGEVTLNGTVENRKVKRMVEANVDMIPGVIDVHNRLNLSKPESKEQMRKEQEARKMADEFPGGEENSGPAGYEPDVTY